MLSSLLLSCWLGHILICYCCIRSVSSTLVRTLFAVIPCAILTYLTSQHLLQYAQSSIITVALCWLTSIRLVHLAIFTTDKQLIFGSFVGKIFWILFPVLPIQCKRNEWPIRYYFILIVSKLLINHWIYRWSLSCGARVSYGRVLMFYVSLSTISYIFDAEIILVRILSGNRYTVESFTNFPLFSSSIREFWGQRYNRFVGTVFKESLFEPIRSKCSSPTLGGLTTFVVSGLLHVHIGIAVFHDTLSVNYATFLFFLIHGLACSLESKLKMQFPEYVGWFFTQTFLLVTTPMILEPFMTGSSFLEEHPPPFFDVEWIPKLPVPKFCP